MNVLHYGAPMVHPAFHYQWKNMSHLVNGAPTADPNAQFSAVTGDATGVELVTLDTVSVDGIREGTLWDLGLVADLLPGFVADGSVGIMIEGELVTAGPDSVDYWQALVVITDQIYAATSGVGPSYRRSGATDVCRRLLGAGDAPIAGVTTRYRSVITPSQDASEFGAITQGGTAVSDDIVTISCANLRFAFVAGCESAGSAGPHTGKVRWSACAVPLVGP